MRATARSTILDAADELFGSAGFDATSTRAIAQVCGVNKALIHYHFQTKDDLFAAVMDRYYGALETALAPALFGEARGVRERLAQLLDAYCDFLAGNPSFSRIVQREAAGGRHLQRIVARMVPLFEAGVALLAAEFPASKRGPLAGPQLLISFYGMVVSYFTFSPVIEGLTERAPLEPRSLEARKAHLQRMADIVLDALEAEHGSKPAKKVSKRKRSKTRTKTS